MIKFLAALLLTLISVAANAACPAGALPGTWPCNPPLPGAALQPTDMLYVFRPGAGLSAGPASPAQIVNTINGLGTDISSGVAAPTNGFPRALSAWVGDVVNAKDFGAVGDGASHTANATLGITTLAGLAAYTINNLTPYSWVSAAPYGSLYAGLPASQPSSTGATTVFIGVTQLTGLTFKTSAITFTGNNLISTATNYNLPPGTAVGGSSCIPSDAVISQQFGTTFNVTHGLNGVAANMTCDLASNVSLTFGISSYAMPVVSKALAGQSTATLVGQTPIQIATGYVIPGTLPNTMAITGGSGTTEINQTLCATNFTTGTLTLCNAATVAVPPNNAMFLLSGCAIYLQDVAGVSAGMQTTIPGFGTTYVEDVNFSTGLTKLSKCVGAPVGNTSLTFTWPDASKIVPGTTIVNGPGIPANDVVTAYNASTGAVTLQSATTANQTTSTLATVAAPALRGSPMTFWTPFTNAQAQTLQMDALGIIAAEKTAETFPAGAQVKVPRGKYLIDQPIIVPVFGVFSAHPHVPSVNIAGDGQYSTVLAATGDLGKDRYILSCGDSTATPESGTGIYGDNGQGAYCDGEFRDLSVTTPASQVVFGVRPTISGVPVQMGGIWGGPRRNMFNLAINNFNVGLEYHADHTILQNVISYVNGKNLHMGWAMSLLFGDDTIISSQFYGGSLCNFCVAADTWWNGEISNDTYFGYSPYSILCESGAKTVAGTPTYTVCMVGATLTNPNLEAAACGMIRDDNFWPDVFGSHTQRILQNVQMTNPFASMLPTYTPIGGCPWVSYINSGPIIGMTIDQLQVNAFTVVAGAYGAFTPARLDDFGQGRGGFTINGPGLIDMFSQYGSSCVPVVGGAAAVQSFTTFYGSNSWDGVRWSIPGAYSGGFGYWTDATTTVPALGTITENITTSGHLVLQAKGRATDDTAPTAGVVAQKYNSSNCTGVGKEIAVATAGNDLPLAVPGAEAVGVMLTNPVNAGTPGVTAVSATVSAANWIVQNANGGSTSLVFGRPVGH